MVQDLLLGVLQLEWWGGGRGRRGGRGREGKWEGEEESLNEMNYCGYILNHHAGGN